MSTFGEYLEDASNYKIKNAAYSAYRILLTHGIKGSDLKVSSNEQIEEN
jgi:hypothetical protein